MESNGLLWNSQQSRSAETLGSIFWKGKEIYAQLLKNPDEVVTGTVKELAEKYDVDIMTMTGFLDGIDDSLVESNPIEEMEEDTRLALDLIKPFCIKIW